MRAGSASRAGLPEGLPRGWVVRPLKYTAQLNPAKLSESTPAEFAFHYVDIGNVNALGAIVGTEEMLFGYAPSRARRLVQAGDCIISTVRTYLRAIAYIEDERDLVVSTGFAVVRAGPLVHPRFLLRVLQSEPFVQGVVANSDGVSYPAISPSRLGRMSVWLPPIEEQESIAGFLDRELPRYDALARPDGRTVVGVGGFTEAFANLVAERRASLITAAVTGQIDVGSAA